MLSILMHSFIESVMLVYQYDSILVNSLMRIDSIFDNSSFYPNRLLVRCKQS